MSVCLLKWQEKCGNFLIFDCIDAKRQKDPRFLLDVVLVSDQISIHDKFMQKTRKQQMVLHLLPSYVTVYEVLFSHFAKS